ncbi:MAG: 30S ribosomal protein S6 [Leptospirales bacterium]|nr:30S ribosomal protein S6 [Leptospirales bacterium]
MNNYELIAILDPARLDAARKSLGDIMQRHKVSKVEENDWGERRLPHDIDKIGVGRFLCINVKAEPERLREFRHDLEIDSNILRYMMKRVA